MDIEKIKGNMDTRTILIFILVVLAVIFAIQNLTPIDFKLLFITISMPGLIFYALLVGIGFLIGYLFAGRKNK